MSTVAVMIQNLIPSGSLYKIHLIKASCWYAHYGACRSRLYKSVKNTFHKNKPRPLAKRPDF